MKKIALITRNKIFAQSFEETMKSNPELRFGLFLLLNSEQALLDAEVLEIDIALIDAGLIDVVDKKIKENEINPSFCEMLHAKLPNVHILLLVSQDDKEKRKMAIEAKMKNVIDDFMFYDASLKYLFAKLLSF